MSGAEFLTAVQTADSLLNLAKTVRQVILGVKSVNQDVQDLCEELGSLSNAIESIRTCLSDEAFARALQNAQANTPNVFTSLTNCFENCDRTVVRLQKVMAKFDQSDDQGLKRLKKYARLKNKGEDLQSIRQQLSTHLTCVQASFMALQTYVIVCGWLLLLFENDTLIFPSARFRDLQTDERDQTAYAKLQANQVELQDSLDALRSRQNDVQETIRTSSDNMDEEQRILKDAEAIRLLSMRIQKSAMAELQRRVTIQRASESKASASTIEDTTSVPRRRPIRRSLVPSGPTFEVPEEPQEQPSMRPLMRTYTGLSLLIAPNSCLLTRW